MLCLVELTPAYIACMEDILALYERPYNAKEPVVCLDEKPVSLHAHVRAPQPARPGHAAKRDNEYRRCGTANIFGVVEPKAGRHFTCATRNRSAAAFARMVRTLVRAYPRTRTTHLIVDNLNTHREKALTDTFGNREGRRLWRRPCTTPPSMGAGSIRRRSNSASSRASALASAASRRSPPCDGKRARGPRAPRVSGPRSTGSSLGKRRADVFGYQKLVSKRSEYSSRSRTRARLADRQPQELGNL